MGAVLSNPFIAFLKFLCPRCSKASAVEIKVRTAPILKLVFSPPRRKAKQFYKKRDDGEEPKAKAKAKAKAKNGDSPEPASPESEKKKVQKPKAKKQGK